LIASSDSAGFDHIGGTIVMAIKRDLTASVAAIALAVFMAINCTQARQLRNSN
jgi:hypothetical protein